MKRCNAEIRSSVKRQKLRAQLLQTSSVCFWCGMQLEASIVGPPDGVLPANFPTLEHLFPRGHGLRRLNIGRARSIVLACFDCNFWRSHGRSGPWDEFMPLYEATILRFLGWKQLQHAERMAHQRPLAG